MHTDWDNADNDTREAIATLHTAGNGYWSEHATAVRITALVLDAWQYEDGYMSGELRVHFNTDDWRVDKHGLIYTDKLFAKELKEYLTAQGYDASDVSYSEQGMQGDNYVSCDASDSFIKSYAAKHADFVIEQCDV